MAKGDPVLPRWRCPFCLFTANADPSHVAASRLLAVHLVLVHRDYFDELIQHATDEWVTRRDARLSDSSNG